MAVGSVLTVFWRDYWGKYRYVHPVIRKNVFIDDIIMTATPKPLYAGDILCLYNKCPLDLKLPCPTYNKAGSNQIKSYRNLPGSQRKFGDGCKWVQSCTENQKALSRCKDHLIAECLQ